MLKIKYKTRSVIALIMMAILCTNITLSVSATSVAQTENNTGEKYYLDLNSNTMERDTILLHEYDGTIYIIINDLCSLTRSTSTFENDVFTVTQGFWNVTFDYAQQQFSDGWQTIDTQLINTGTYYLVPAIEFLTYFGANVQIDKENNIFYCLMPECTAWEALAIDYESTLIDIYDLYGGEGNVKFSLTLDILMDFLLNGTPNNDDYLLDAYNESLSINLCDYDSIHNYQKERNESLYDYLISDEGQDAADFAATLLDTSISGVEYLCETYYSTLNLKFTDLVKSSYQSGMLDESTHYASQILGGYRKNKAISNLAETSKIPLTQVAPVFIQTALESAQQLKYVAATNNLAYHVMGSENTDYLGLNVDDNDWFRIADTYKNTATVVSNNFVDNAVDSFADMGWDQLIGDCVHSFTGTSALLFTFSKECATSFAKWFPLTSSSVQAFESDRMALYLSELQQNVAYVIANIDFSNDYENEEKYQKYIEANLLYCRVSIAMYENLITMVGEFGNDREYWKSLFQERIDALAVSMYKLTLFQDDGAYKCIPLNISQYRNDNLSESIETEEINIFLSTIYQNGIREYNFKNYDINSLMEFAYFFPAEGTSYEDNEGNYFYVVPYENVNNILNTYFSVTAPREQIGDIVYKDEKYYYPFWDYGELGLPVIVANSVEREGDTYKILFDIGYIWPENFDTGEENPVDDWNSYYKYDKTQIENDEFCEIIGYGDAIIETKEGNMIILEFHAYEGYSTQLDEEEAYKELEKYWTSLGKNMPENVECEGLTEYGYCFWGYNMFTDHAVTQFRICVDINTGRLFDFTWDVYLN